MDHEVWFANAKASAEKLPPDTIFALKDLFQGTVWSTLARGDRLSLGRYFKSKVECQQVPNVRYLRKAQNNSALYVKFEQGGDNTCDFGSIK